ncbi:Gfo/Idh/MocA family oxidoreductase [uncultured Methanobacterium sp.]|uniref:Gfo/Idh/MocA family protein n=1 Tax=uncultured Methanobacterium sp. TaxID=176306 RepID=UPI002AA92F30|nr:Gfo/Idh/MocA family oxidoreductase [uncultured Methanobacterium sp.]
MTDLNLGIVGLGKMGALHYGNLEVMDDVNVVCAAEANKQVYNYTKKMLDIPIYTDYKQLVKHELDAIVVCVPDELHSPLGNYFAENNVNVFMEKPLADSVENAKKMVEYSEKNGIITQVGYFNRFASTFKKGKELLDNNILGELFYSRGFSYEGLVFEKNKGWRFSKNTDLGGSLLDIGSHIIDILLWYFGEVETLFGIKKDAFSNADYGSSILKYKGGLTSTVDFSWSSHSHRQMHNEIQIEGSNGFMKVNNDYIKLFLNNSTEDFEEGWTTIYGVELYEPSEFLIGVETAYFDEDKHFVECCNTNKKTIIDWNDGLITQAILEGIIESNKTNKVIEMRDIIE